MASDERAPRNNGTGGQRREGSGRKDGSSYRGSSSKPGSSSSSRRDGTAGTSGSGYKGSSRDGTAGKSGSAYKGSSSRDTSARGDRPAHGGSQRDGERRGAPYKGSRDGRLGERSGARSARGGSGRSDDSREQRKPRDDKPKGPPAPEIPEEIVIGQLDRTVRARLRTLSKENAEDVGRHLIMAGNLIDSDPELAYRHAMVAASRGGRVDVVREAAAVTAYATGRYAEALREFRTVRRLNGSSEHLPLMADCERGLGRPERAIALSQEPEAKTLSPAGRIELAIVIAGARSDMGEKEAALVSLKRLSTNDPALRARIDEATAAVLRELGRDEEADALEPEAVPVEEPEEDVVVYDTFEDEREQQA